MFTKLDANKIQEEVTITKTYDYDSLIFQKSALEQSLIDVQVELDRINTLIGECKKLSIVSRSEVVQIDNKIT